MRLTIMGFLTAAAVLTADVQSGVAQHNARFCLHGGRSAIPNCSYPTLEQCRASILANQYCTENPNYSEPEPSTSTSPTVATAPKATNRTVSRPASKKANTQPRLDVQRERELFEEFLDW